MTWFFVVLVMPRFVVFRLAGIQFGIRIIIVYRKKKQELCFIARSTLPSVYRLPNLFFPCKSQPGFLICLLVRM